MVQQLKVYSYIITDTETNDITIYVRGSNPYLYAWDDDGILTATWPGTRLNNSKGVGGLDWSYKTFTKKNSGYTLNCIITEGNDGPQTSDITGVGHDMFYMFSDGYSDQFGGENGKKLKFKRFKSYIEECQQFNLPKQGITLNKMLQQWQGNWEQVDDILVMGFDFNIYLEDKQKEV